MYRSATLLSIVLAACSSTPTTYRNAGWATVSVEQAQAECQAHINSLAGLGSNMYLCMRAKGWQEE